MSKKSKKYCRGCRDDYYNEEGHSEKGECRLLSRAKVVTRFKLGWWTQPAKGAYEKVKTYSCHHAPGKYAMEHEIPAKFR